MKILDTLAYTLAGLFVVALGVALAGDESATESTKVTDPAQLESLHTAITEGGHFCPRVALAYDKGAAVQTFCGPDGGGITPRLGYRVVMTDGLRAQVQPREW